MVLERFENQTVHDEGGIVLCLGVSISAVVFAKNTYVGLFGQFYPLIPTQE